jgi:hypothetical protein
MWLEGTFLPKYCTGEEIKDFDTEETCGWYREKKMHTGF